MPISQSLLDFSLKICLFKVTKNDTRRTITAYEIISDILRRIKYVSTKFGLDLIQRFYLPYTLSILIDRKIALLWK